MAMTPSGGSNDKGVTPAMNVTPLVDVVLVLLIIFMVVTPLLTKQFWLNLPKKDDTAETPPAAADEDKPVVLTVETSGTVKVNQSVVARSELRDKLTRIYAARKDHVLYFDAADDAPYGVTVEVMDIARRSGARSIAILTERPKG